MCEEEGGIDGGEYEYLKPAGCIPLTANKQEQVLSGNTGSSSSARDVVQ